MFRGKTLLRAVVTTLGPTLCLAVACAWPASARSADVDGTTEIVGFKLRDGLEPVELDEFCRKDVSDTTLALLRREGMVGSLECGLSGRFQTRAARGKIIVIMTHQVSAPVELPLPVGEVVYRQFDDAWQPYPVDAETTDESLTLYPDPASPEWATMFWLTTRRGGRTGGTLVTWGTRDR